MSRVAAILLAAGRGERLGADEPKALVELAGLPLVAHAVAAVEACPDIDGFVLTVPADRGDDVAAAAPSPKWMATVTGGRERQDSVALALAAMPDDIEIVVCHDVARPLARPELFAGVIAAVADGGPDGPAGAVPAVPATDTLKRIRQGVVAQTLDRDDVVVVQTPQAFRRAALEDAHRRAVADGARGTDDAALLERAGYRVVVVAGDPDNFKITVASDLRRAEALAASRG